MRNLFISFCNYTIEYTFYAIFLTVPFAFTDKTFELFEFNKMWLLFGYTIIIAAAWICKMIAQKRFFIQKTPLDIALGLFLLSQIISTIFSMDSHLSLWGYYSRFNGGLFSILSYILLYYGFASNISFKTQDNEKQIISNAINGIVFTKRILMVSVIAGILVALWGYPSHFGYDPTCLVFRGTFDVSCWTADFQPRIRIFSTLGQPNWLAAYLAILLPILLAFALNKIHLYGKKITQHKKEFILFLIYVVSAILFYVDIIYTDSQSGFLGTIAALGIFGLGYLYLTKKTEKFSIAVKALTTTVIVVLLLAFFIGIPVTQLKKFTYAYLQVHTTQSPTNTTAAPVKQAGTALEGGGAGGTESSTIRRYVWQGAIDAWKDNPIFGTGVETFAFAYYKYRPVGHNMTSEWDFLYNKAHNEYLNYLATTGAFGLITYLAFIGLFLFYAWKQLQKKDLIWLHKLLILGMLAGFVSMLVSNFFGFSVVLVNLYLFIIPIFVFILADTISPLHGIFSSLLPNITPSKKDEQTLSGMQWTSISIIICIALYQLYILTTFWMADMSFALAKNLNNIGQYNQGYTEIRKALALRSDEPTFQEELATSDAAIAASLIEQKQNDAGTKLANEAMQTINQLTTDYPNNLNFLKSEVRIYYTLAQFNPQYMGQALTAMEKSHVLAPTDAKISYNLGVIYGQTGQTEKGITILEQTIKMKPDYREAYYALGLFYHDLGVNKSGKLVNPIMEEKAVSQMHFILNNFSKTDKQASDSLKSWGEM